MKTKWQKNPRSEGIPFWAPLPAWFWENGLTLGTNTEPSRWSHWTPYVWPPPEAPKDL